MQVIRSNLLASGFVYLCASCLLPGSASAQAPAAPPSKAAGSGGALAKPAGAPAQPAGAPAKAPAPPAEGEGHAGGVTEPDAQSEPPEAVLQEAKQRFDRGFELYDEGEYSLALIEFSRAYQLVPNYRVLYNIGQVCIQLGQYANARRALEEYRLKGGDELGRERREAIARDLEMLGLRTAFLAITSNVEGAEVLVDDISVGKTPLGPALLVDAGVHRISVRRHGYQSRSARVTLAGGDEQALALTLEPVPEARPTIVVRERPAVEDSSQTLMIAGWVTTGALVAGAIVTGFMGVGEADELEQLKGADARDYDDLAGRLEDTQSNAKSLLLASDILSGAAIVVGGLSLWITIDPFESGDANRASEPPKALRVGYEDNQLQVRASF